MRRFAALYAELDASTATEAKLAALQRYLADAPPGDAAWALYFLAGGKPRQTVPTALLRAESFHTEYGAEGGEMAAEPALPSGPTD